ncbi:MAG: hypothetical protein M3134_06835 [Actinomycetota bacterium]|nr:hypothetical protein [Actinomycetota bacterium]
MSRRSPCFSFALVLVLTAGCSDEPAGDPRARAAVVEAVRSMGDPEPATMELSLPYADADDLVQLSIGVRPENAEVMESARFTLKNDWATDPLEAHFEMKLELAAGSVEARQIEDDVYLRGDVAALADSLGADTRPLVRTLSREAGLRSLVRPVLRGKWIHVFGAGDLLPAASGSGSSERSEQAAAAFAEAIGDSADVTADGSDRAGDKYHVEFELREFAGAFFEAAEGLVPPPPEGALDDAPDATVAADVWVEDGLMRRLEFDAAHLVDISRPGSAIDRDPVIVRFDVRPFDPDELRAPKAAAKVHARVLFRLIAAAQAGAQT